MSVEKGELTAVVVTTSHQGVFFGYSDCVVADGSVNLAQARMCVYWPEETHGVVGLAAVGPTDRARISPAAPNITLRDVTAVMQCSAEAITRWEAEPWT